MKARHQEPSQHYASLEWFIDDIRRHQRGLTVSAHPGIQAYRAATFCRRHATVLMEIGETIAVFQSVYPPGRRQLASAHSALGESLLIQGKISEAERLFVDSAKQLGESLRQERRLAMQRLIRQHEAQGNLVSARQLQDELAAFERNVRSR